MLHLTRFAYISLSTSSARFKGCEACIQMDRPDWCGLFARKVFKFTFANITRLCFLLLLCGPFESCKYKGKDYIQRLIDCVGHIRLSSSIVCKCIFPIRLVCVSVHCDLLYYRRFGSLAIIWSSH